MKYTYKASQTTIKIVEIEAVSDEEADEKAQQMLEEGEIHFDDEPWLEMESRIKRI